MKKPLLIGVGATLAMIVVAVQMWQSLRAEREQNEALESRVATLEAAALMPVVSATEPQSTAEGSASGGVSAGAAVPAPRVPAAGQPAAAQAAPGSLVTPQTADFALAMMRQMLLQQYPDLEQELGLTRAEADQFMQLLIRQQEQMGTESMAMFMGGGQQGAVDMQQMQRRMVEMEQTSEAEQEAMLGSRYPRWEEYQGVAAARTQVSQLRTALNAGGSPLSDAQAAALVTAFATEETRIQRDERQWMTSRAALESPNMMVEQVQRVGASRQQLVDAAAGVLNPEQLDLYRRQVEQQIAVLGATMGMLESMTVPGQGQPAAPTGPY